MDRYRIELGSFVLPLLVIYHPSHKGMKNASL